MNLKIYGCRGSMPVYRADTVKYGGNTSCMVLSLGDTKLILDAGSGILPYYWENSSNGFKSADILISHLHIDHIIGLPLFLPHLRDLPQANIYTCSRNDEPLAEQVLGIFRPPYWPVNILDSVSINCIEIHPDKSFEIGPFTITTFLADHPDQTYSFHITDGKKVLVHLLDNEVRKNWHGYNNMLKYCKNADLVIFDAAYSAEEYKKHEGWGHSTIEEGINLARENNIKKMVFGHFDQKFTDEDLDKWQSKIDPSRFILSKDGLEINF